MATGGEEEGGRGGKRGRRNRRLLSVGGVILISEHEHEKKPALQFCIFGEGRAYSLTFVLQRNLGVEPDEE